MYIIGMNDMYTTMNTIPNKDVRILLDRDLANELKKMMNVGDTYTSIIRGLLNKSKQ